jgi:hypothetical protein
MLFTLLNLFFFVQNQLDPLGEMIGKSFLDHISAKDWKRSSSLMANEVNFDGEIVKGEGKIQKKLKVMLEDHKAEIHIKRIYFFSGEDALKKFGPLPVRLKSVDLKKSIVVLARRKAGGLVIVLQEVANIEKNWRVVALTD